MKQQPGTRNPSQVFGAMREFSSVREFFTAATIGSLADIPVILIFLLVVASIGGNLVWISVIGGVLMVALTHATQGHPCAPRACCRKRCTSRKPWPPSAALTDLDTIAGTELVEALGRKYLRRERLTGVYELRNLEFEYDATSAATVEIHGCKNPASQHVAVLGSDGSGKSTRAICAGASAIRQEVRLFSGSIRDNLNMNQLERDDVRQFDALDFAGMGQFIRNHPRTLILQNGKMAVDGPREAVLAHLTKAQGGANSGNLRPRARGKSRAPRPDNLLHLWPRGGVHHLDGLRVGG